MRAYGRRAAGTWWRHGSKRFGARARARTRARRLGLAWVGGIPTLVFDHHPPKQHRRWWRGVPDPIDPDRAARPSTGTGDRRQRAARRASSCRCSSTGPSRRRRCPKTKMALLSVLRTLDSDQMIGQRRGRGAAVRLAPPPDCWVRPFRPMLVSFAGCPREL